MNNLTCLNCETVKSFQPIALDFDAIARIASRYVCDTCLFTLPLPEAEYIPITEYIPEANDDQTIEDQDREIDRKSKVMPSGIKRDTSKMRLADLFKLGRIAYGDNLRIEGKIGSLATVIDARSIRLAENGQVMTWNAYGQKFTGHVAVNIYKHIDVNGKLLETLRY